LPLFSVKPSQIGESGLQTPLSTHVTKATLQLATNPTKLLSALSLCHVWPCSYEQHTAPVAVDLKNDESVGSVWKKHCLSLVQQGYARALGLVKLDLVIFLTKLTSKTSVIWPLFAVICRYFASILPLFPVKHEA